MTSSAMDTRMDAPAPEETLTERPRLAVVKESGVIAVAAEYGPITVEQAIEQGWDAFNDRSGTDQVPFSD